MISRRAFLSRMAVTLGAIALAPSVVDAMADAGQRIPLDVTKQYTKQYGGSAMLADGSYEAMPLGLADVVASPTLHGLSPSTYVCWSQGVEADVREMLRREEMLRRLGRRPTPVRLSARWQARA